ncbi:UNVERIFIED_CONTAM: hypothetical protein FKN15_067547 [Acipenser sinensis]
MQAHCKPELNTATKAPPTNPTPALLTSTHTMTDSTTRNNSGTSSHLNSSSAWFCLITNFNSTKFTSGYQVQLRKTKEEVICVYWKYEGKESSWSTEGCTKLLSNQTHTVCSCDHLSSFAVLMALDESQVLCAVIAGLLHYLFTASFAWMCLEGVQLYLLVRNLKVVKYSSRQGLRRRYLLLAGYGFPALIVAVSAGVFTEGYGTDKFCWLSHDRGFAWSFLGPVCVTIAVNTILFIAILWTLRSQMCGLNTDVSKVKDTRLLTFKAIAQCFIMGCSWILGFFQGLEFFRFVFVIINSLQGPFIFLVHCVLNQQVRMEYRKWFGCIYKQKDSSELTSSAVPKGNLTEKKRLEACFLRLFDDVGQGPTLDRKGKIAMSDQVQYRTAKG